MTNDFERIIDTIADTATEPEDYTGEDGLLYCGKCRTPKEAFFPADKIALFGRDRHPAECDCQRAKRIERETAEQCRKHLDTVEDLKRRGFTDPAMRRWTFENDNGRNPLMEQARRYVKKWDEAQKRISDFSCGEKSAQERPTLRAVSQTPSWSRKSPSA